MDAVALSRGERLAVWIAGVVVALSRLPAISRSLWDWDEALFMLALRDYDVVAYHPHPPGFPLFIGLAKLIPLDSFHALQLIAVVSSMLVFPAMFFLARELRASFFVAFASSVLLAILPNVWFFGGTAFSDVPSLVLVLFACALLLRGRQSDRALIAGAIVLAIAAGFRPQNLLIGFVPAILALRARPRTAIIGAFLGVLILGASYGAAAHASGGWDVYRGTLARHERYIRETDSFLSSIRPWLVQVADDFFLRPFRAPAINIVLVLLMMIGVVRRARGTAMIIAIFGPFLIFAWLYLDFHSASRFSIGYMPLFALLAAAGIPRRGQFITLGAVAALIVLWMMPVLRVVRDTDSPPVAAIAAIRAMPASTIVYVDEALGPHAALLLTEYERRPIEDAVNGPAGVMLRERESRAAGARNFVRTRDRVAGVARARYFEISITPSP
jgi:hypothetical protein